MATIGEETAGALTELIADFGETVIWRPYDRATSYTLTMFVTNNTAIVLKSTVTAVSPNRAPQNGDVLINTDGIEMKVKSVNGAFDQVMDGGFAEKPALRSAGQVFYRIICGAEIT